MVRVVTTYMVRCIIYVATTLYYSCQILVITVPEPHEAAKRAIMCMSGRGFVYSVYKGNDRFRYNHADIQSVSLVGVIKKKI